MIIIMTVIVIILYTRKQRVNLPQNLVVYKVEFVYRQYLYCFCP